MSKIDELLSRLDGVRQTSKVSWMSRCPHHADKTPSLRITLKGDRILIHCFAGCSPLLILSDLGLSWDALYPDDDGNYQVMRKNERQYLRDSILEIAEASLKSGVKLSEADKLVVLRARLGKY